MPRVCHFARACIAAGSAAVIAAPALAQVDPLSGIDFAHIASPGNAPWPGNGQQGDTAIGRGGVNYEYNIGRLEVTTAQWTEFFNAVYDRPVQMNIEFIHAPSIWGAAAAAPTNPGGARWAVPAGNELLPVGGISWRTAAIYCNWLSNGKSTAPSAFLNGAYDVSTFHDLGNGFTDQITHNTNAQYWIPTWDEYLKAAHFDPNRNGPGQPGYWIEDSTIGHLPVAGPPGIGDANYGFSSPNPFIIPLGSYTNVHSAFGLLDLAGGTSEWTEDVLSDFGQSLWRRFEGSGWNSSSNDVLYDTIYISGDNSPAARSYTYGLRIASSVPAPATGVLLAGVLSFSLVHRRKRTHHAQSTPRSTRLRRPPDLHL